jgi:hypothetical protein
MRRGRVSCQIARLRRDPIRLDLANPPHQWVPTGENLGHQTFISGSDLPQVAEGRRGYAGSNKPISVERDSVWEEQLLEPLPLLE